MSERPDATAETPATQPVALLVFGAALAIGLMATPGRQTAVDCRRNRRGDAVALHNMECVS